MLTALIKYAKNSQAPHCGQRIMDDFIEETKGLYRLSNYLHSLLIDENCKGKNKEMIIDLCVEIENAMHLLSLYDNVTENEDLKHEFGFKYSESLDKVEENVNLLMNNGISLHLH